MYRRRPILVTFNSLRASTKACNRPPSSSLFSIHKRRFCRNFYSSIERPDYCNYRNELSSENGTNSFQHNQYGYVNGSLGGSQQNFSMAYCENPNNQFQYNQDRNFIHWNIESGPRNGLLGNPGGENGRWEVGYVDHHQRNGNFGVYNGWNGMDMWQQNVYGYGNDYGQLGFASYLNGGEQYGEVNGGFNQIPYGVYSGGNYGNLQQGWEWDGGTYGINNGNSQHLGVTPGHLHQSWSVGYSGVSPGNLHQSWNAGYSGVSPGNLHQSWNAGYSGVSSGNLHQSWNAGYSGENNVNLQQSWKADNFGWSSGNPQHCWGVGYFDGSNGHPPQHAGMHQDTSHDNYAGNGGTLQFPQGNRNAGNMGMDNWNTGFSNHGNVVEYQQITIGSHQSDVGFVQQTSNQSERGHVGTLGESSVKPSEESEVVFEDQLKAVFVQQTSNQCEHLLESSVKSNEEPEVVLEGQLKGTMKELDKFYQEHKLKEAVDVIGLLEEQHISVDLSRYLLLLKACGEEKALEEGRLIHKHLLRSGLQLKIDNTILEMYCSCGSWDDAFNVFNKMPSRNLTTWDTMISSLAKNGDGEDAIALFTQFKEAGLTPDGRMFLGIFSACGVVGDTVEGLLHFKSMKKDYSIVPSMEHYISVVDMLGAAGNPDEALEFIEKMPLEPSIEVWEVLMNLCRIHGNLELGNRCAELVEVLDRSRLDEQSRAGYLPLKTSVLAKGEEKKKSGQRFPEGRTRVHEYRSGDISQLELYDLLRRMRQQLKEVGYIPEVAFVINDIDPECKEEALMAHSERLAVAQGLMTTPARSPIRILKNIRICVDCHNMMKMVSKLVGRELIIRDFRRFHHFKDGLCSCRDYW